MYNYELLLLTVMKCIAHSFRIYSMVWLFNGSCSWKSWNGKTSFINHHYV